MIGDIEIHHLTIYITSLSPRRAQKMEQNETILNLRIVGWTFQLIREIAKDIKPAGWIVVANKYRLSFMEITLGQHGPAVVDKQLILDHSMNIEGYICGQKVKPDVLPISPADIHSAKDLYNCLKSFASYGTCQGNRNFKRINKNGKVGVTDYWKHADCELIYEKSLHRPENCCNACLQLNSYLPKKINNTYLSLNQPGDMLTSQIYKNGPNTKTIKTEGQKQGKRKKSDLQDESKKIKQEVEESRIEELFITVKQEPLF